MNQALLAQIQMLKSDNKTPNFSELSRQYAIDRRTIKRYYDGYEGKPQHRNKPSKLDKHQDLIKEKLSIRGIKISSVYQYFISEIDADIGSYSNFRKYIKQNNLSPQKTLKGHPRFETTPGYQAQADWKEDLEIHNKFGEVFTIQVFDYKLGYSRHCHYTLKLTKTLQDVFDCLIESFIATGGVPKEILFDNMSSFVNWSGNKRSVSNRMKAFAKDFGFKIRLAKPKHPYTKGKVENNIKFLNWLLPYQGEFETLDELNVILQKVNHNVNNTVCQSTNMKPILLWQKETDLLNPLPDRDIITAYQSKETKVRVGSDSMINYKGIRYSVPPYYMGKYVTLKLIEQDLLIYHEGNCIAAHKVSVKKLNYQREHYEALLSGLIQDDKIAIVAEKNLKQMDALL